MNSSNPLVAPRPLVLSSALVFAFALVAGCGGGSDTPAPAPAPAPTPAPPPPPPPPGAVGCTAIANILATDTSFPANTAITSTTLVAAAGSLPEYCKVVGTVNAGRVGAMSSPGVTQTYAINWTVSLPTTWNGRYTHEGGGGLDGSVPGATSRLAAGYAMASDDSGHSNSVNNDPLADGGATFGTDYQARVDFAYNAIDQTSQLAKKLIADYYGSAPQFSYFEGCSMGGREGMMVTQKLPTRFDGVVIGDPGFKLTAMSNQEVYNAQMLAGLATSMGLTSINGVPLINNTFTNNDLQLVSNAILQACDAKDGLVDGMVNAPQECTTPVVTPFLNALTCTGAKTATCLTAGQIDAIQKIYAGPITQTGRMPYSPWQWDPGIAGCTSATDCNAPGATNIATGWRSWKLGQFQSNLATATNGGNDFSSGAGGGLTTMVAPTPPHAPASTSTDDQLKVMLGYDLDAYLASIFATSTAFPTSSHTLLDVDSTDLSAFNGHGGKAIIYQPQTGGPFSPLAMENWYQAVNVANGGTPFDYSATQSFLRLFMMPGAQHCGGGPSTSTIDAFSAVVNWVENKTPPASIVGTAPATTPWPGRTRPLCPFPAFAHYIGTGSIEVASNFVCQ
jgi:Tannase and feruloyl esterase